MGILYVTRLALGMKDTLENEQVQTLTSCHLHCTGAGWSGEQQTQNKIIIFQVVGNDKENIKAREWEKEQ